MAAKLSPHDRQNLGKILGGYGDWFSAQLMRLIMKADRENRERLRLAFPDHVEAYEQYVNEPDWNEVVAQYKLDTE